MVREDLVVGAVSGPKHTIQERDANNALGILYVDTARVPNNSFTLTTGTVLQDPTVASAPLEQRIAFLRSKNLTQEEIDVSLIRVGSEPASSSPQPPQNTSYQQSPAYRQGPPQQYGGYQNGYWQQPPPEVPRRDWRDWFIMATVVGGVGYGVYFVAKRYIYPLVAPPTPPQLEQDKAAIDASFDKTFALIEQLSSDTEELKNSEKTRTERLDAALSEVEAIVGQMKDASRRRDDEGRRMNDEVRALKDLIPRAIDAQKESSDARLKELGTEMKSLKTLISNRMTTATPRPMSSTNPYSAQSSTTTNGGSVPAQEQSPISTNGTVTTEGANGIQEEPRKSALPPSQVPDRSSNSSPYGRMMNGRAAIPAWQMAAAAKKNEEAKPDTAESGTAVDGAAA